MASITPSVAGGSENLQISPVPSHVKAPRSWYLHYLASLLVSSSSSPTPVPPSSPSPQLATIHPYWLAHSSFIRPEMVSHLMKRKKPLALGVKFRQSPVVTAPSGRGSGDSSSRTRHVDAVTNMEGALHTFVMPVVRTLIHGDYQYQYGHSICEFGESEIQAPGRGGSSSSSTKGRGERFQLAREVLISGLVHLDFEYESVMWEFVRDDDLKALLPAETDSGALGASSETSAATEVIDETIMISVPEKHDSAKRRAYDALLRRQARLHLLHAQGADIDAFVRSAKDPTQHINLKEAVDLLTSSIRACSASTSTQTNPTDPKSTGNNPAAIITAVTNKWLLIAPNSAARLAGRFARDKLSLHLLFLSVLHQVRNEHALLDRVVDDVNGASDTASEATSDGDAGYVYTYDPPQIFRRALGDEGKELLTALHAAALRHLLVAASISGQGYDPGSTAFACRMRVFAYNDFGNPGAMGLMRAAFRERLAIPNKIEKGQVLVVRKADLFAGEPGPDEDRAGSPGGLYRPPDCVRGRGYWLVLHNNSDGFGNNVENEAGMGSLDAVLGEFSGMAAALRLHDPALGADGDDDDDDDGEEGKVVAGSGRRRRKRRRKNKEGGDAQPASEKGSRVMALSDESLGLRQAGNSVVR